MFIPGRKGKKEIQPRELERSRVRMEIRRQAMEKRANPLGKEKAGQARGDSQSKTSGLSSLMFGRSSGAPNRGFEHSRGRGLLLAGSVSVLSKRYEREKGNVERGKGGGPS